MKHSNMVNVCVCSFRIDTEFFLKGRAFSETIFNYFICLSCLIESGDQELPLKVNHEEDDFFMDSSPSPGK